MSSSSTDGAPKKTGIQSGILSFFSKGEKRAVESTDSQADVKRVREDSDDDIDIDVLAIGQQPSTAVPLPSLKQLNPIPDQMSLPSVDNRQCQRKWFSEFPWLRFCGKGDSLFCAWCHWAVKNKRLNIGNSLSGKVKEQMQDSPWVKGGDEDETGWKNFKGGADKIRIHQGSASHAEAMRVLKIDQDQANVNAVLRGNLLDEQKQNRKGLEAIFKAILAFGTNEIALRGHGKEEETGNLWTIVKLVGEFNVDVGTYINKKKAESESKVIKYMSPDIQNEIITDIGRDILRKITDCVRSESTGRAAANKEALKPEEERKQTYVFSVICDEARDASRKEQVSICVRYCTKDLEADELFMGWHETADTHAGALKDLIVNSLRAINLDFDKIRGQGYDGASNMSGDKAGLQRLIRDENPLALFCYCAGHNLNLMTMDGIKSVPVIAAAMDRINDIVKYCRASPKRLDIFEELCKDQGLGDSKLRPLCKTRWVLKLPAVEAFLKYYEPLMDFLQVMSYDMGQKADSRVAAAGHLDAMDKFQLYFSSRVIQAMLRVVHPIHVMVQGRNVTVGEVKDWTSGLAATFAAMVTDDDAAMAMYREAKSFTTELRMDLPALPRAARGGRARGLALQPVTEEQLEAYYTKMYSNCMQGVSAVIADRYSAQDLRQADLLHNLICNPGMPDAEVDEICDFYAVDFDKDGIKAERRAWFARASREGFGTTVESLRKDFLGTPGLKDIWANLHSALVNFIVLPASSCESERSFSMLRRIKTWLRSTMGQARLNMLALLSAHRDVARAANVPLLMELFIDRATVRRNMFGLL